MVNSRRMIQFGFTNETKIEVDEQEFPQILERAYALLKDDIDKKLLGRNGVLDLILVSDSTMRGLNKEYRDKDKTTDVIAFAYLEVTEYEKQKGDIIVGDIFISVDTAKKQAKKKKHNLTKELNVLFAHGLLHVFGYDHKSKKQEKEMEEMAKKILS